MLTLVLQVLVPSGFSFNLQPPSPALFKFLIINPIIHSPQPGPGSHASASDRYLKPLDRLISINLIEQSRLTLFMPLPVLLKRPIELYTSEEVGIPPSCRPRMGVPWMTELLVNVRISSSTHLVKYESVGAREPSTHFVFDSINISQL
jgi:hypothetical protein